MIALRAPLAERGDDLYETPPVATRALLRVEPLPHRLWEPAAGRGAIVDVLRAAGHEVIGSDLNDYGRPDFFARCDFLLERKVPDACEAILTNPPYKLADQFVAHALDLARRVVMLLRLAFLESERRTPILEGRGLARVHLFRRRLPMMHRDGWQGPRASNAIQFAWFVWDARHVGPPTLHRISWDEDEDESPTSPSRASHYRPAIGVREDAGEPDVSNQTAQVFKELRHDVARRAARIRRTAK